MLGLNRNKEGRRLSVLEQQAASAYASSRIESLCELSIRSRPHIFRMTGIICTIGPACRSIPMLKKMMEAGMNIARLNFSHGTHEYHAETIHNIREAAKEFTRPIAIALDTKGPEIRTGVLRAGVNEEVELVVNSTIRITTDEHYKELVDETIIWVDYKNINQALEVGKRMYIDDGLISLIVTKKEGNDLICSVENGGFLGSRKGCNLPGTDVDLPPVSDKDREDIKFGVEKEVDLVFASFVRSREAINEIRMITGEKGKHIAIIAKIESEEGINYFDEILFAADGIMVARGDLGIEIPQEKVFLAQKMMIGRCNMHFKPVICATQMLESMISKPRPTRAETTDVANAVLDGADCVMLSGETAKGKYPLEALVMMHKISLEAESAVHHRELFEDIRKVTSGKRDIPMNIGLAAVETSINCAASCILIVTETGRSAIMTAGFRPRCPIIAVSPCLKIARQLHLYRGIFPVWDSEEQNASWADNMDRRIALGIREGWRRQVVTGGCLIVIVTGLKPGAGFTNTIRIIEIPEQEQPPTGLRVVRLSSDTLDTVFEDHKEDHKE